MSGIKAPLLDILSRLATLNVIDGNGNTVKLYSRIWNNQLNSERNAEIYDFPKPSAFVEFITPVSFQELGGNFGSADLGINIHLIHEYYNQDGTFEQDLAVFDLRDSIVRLLSQYKPTACGLMVKVSEQQDYDHDNLYHYIIGFVTNFTDSTSSPYDPAAGKYIDSEPPTALQLDVTMDKTPIIKPQHLNFNIKQ